MRPFVQSSSCICSKVIDPWHVAGSSTAPGVLSFGAALKDQYDDS